MAFHDVRFPIDIALGRRGGPERRTEIVELGSGREERNARWVHGRRRFNAGYGVKKAADLAAIAHFFEERRGRLHGFRYRDPLDDRSGLYGVAPTMLDQVIGAGTGAQTAFGLVKAYGIGNPYLRPIQKPVAGSVLVSVNGIAQAIGPDVAVDAASGTLVFQPGRIPAAGAVIRAGYLFDTPVRFDTDFLEIDLSAFDAGAIPDIPLIEIRL
jgi:uncharacterized protein (TIGR02217 family)